jgi:hypothetical protein
MNNAKINGYGAIMWFITPVLITIMLFILGAMREDVKQLKAETRYGFEKSEIYFNNHLSYHRQFDKEISERLSRIEARIK